MQGHLIYARANLPPASMRLVELLKSRGGFEAAKVAMSHTPGMGTGVVATETIEPGEVVLSIDKSLWGAFSEQAAYAQAVTAAPQFVQHVSETVKQIEGSKTSSLAERSNFEASIILAVQLLLKLGDERSPEHAYYEFVAQSLPFDSLPAFWSDKQLESLEGTFALDRIQKRGEFVDMAHELVFGSGQSGAPPITLQQFKWALSAVLSRALSGSPGEDIPFTFIPFFDCLNHHPFKRLKQCEHHYDHATSRWVVTARRPYEPGEQLMISYGQHGECSHPKRVCQQQQNSHVLLSILCCLPPTPPHPPRPRPAGNRELRRQYGFVIDGVDSETGLSNSNDAVDLLVRWPELGESDPLLQVRDAGRVVDCAVVGCAVVGHAH
jgi:hypothetical protein